MDTYTSAESNSKFNSGSNPFQDDANSSDRLPDDSFFDDSEQTKLLLTPEKIKAKAAKREKNDDYDYVAAPTERNIEYFSGDEESSGSEDDDAANADVDESSVNSGDGCMADMFKQVMLGEHEGEHDEINLSPNEKICQTEWTFNNEQESEPEPEPSSAPNRIIEMSTPFTPQSNFKSNRSAKFPLASPGLSPISNSLNNNNNNLNSMKTPEHDGDFLRRGGQTPKTGGGTNALSPIISDSGHDNSSGNDNSLSRSDIDIDMDAHMRAGEITTTGNFNVNNPYKGRFVRKRDQIGLGLNKIVNGGDSVASVSLLESFEAIHKSTNSNSNNGSSNSRNDNSNNGSNNNITHSPPNPRRSTNTNENSDNLNLSSSSHPPRNNHFNSSHSYGIQAMMSEASSAGLKNPGAIYEVSWAASEASRE